VIVRCVVSLRFTVLLFTEMYVFLLLRRLWVHCVALYVISLSACILFHVRMPLHHALIADEFTSKFFLVKSYSITADPHALMLQEYNYISKKRLAHITGSSPNPGHFSVLVRSIPKSDNELLDDTIRNFFVNYHGSSYLSHQMIYRKGKLQRFVVRIYWQ
jgi:calcium permeable stress-gated cation channel